MSRITYLMEQIGGRITFVGLFWTGSLYAVPHWLPAPLLSLEGAILVCLSGLFLISLSKTLQPPLPEADAAAPQPKPAKKPLAKRSKSYRAAPKPRRKLVLEKPKRPAPNPEDLHPVLDRRLRALAESAGTQPVQA